MHFLGRDEEEVGSNGQPDGGNTHLQDHPPGIDMSHRLFQDFDLQMFATCPADSRAPKLKLSRTSQVEYT